MLPKVGHQARTWHFAGGRRRVPPPRRDRFMRGFWQPFDSEKREEDDSQRFTNIGRGLQGGALEVYAHMRHELASLFFGFLKDPTSGLNRDVGRRGCPGGPVWSSRGALTGKAKTTPGRPLPRSRSAAQRATTVTETCSTQNGSPSFPQRISRPSTVFQTLPVLSPLSPLPSPVPIRTLPNLRYRSRTSPGTRQSQHFHPHGGRISCRTLKTAPLTRNLRFATVRHRIP